MGSIGSKNGMIRFKELAVGYDDIVAASKAIESKSLGMGKVVKQLEEEFADYVGAKYAIALNSCTGTLFLALYRDYEWEKEIAVPSMMVPLVVNEILHVDYKPHFVDEISWIGYAYNLGGTNIIDSAHEIYRFKNGWIDEGEIFNEYIVCYSFYPTKPIGGADGGMICTNNEDEANWYRKARNFGRDDTSGEFKNSWEYKIAFPGWRLYMNDLQASIALTQLRKHPANDRTMTSIREYYNAKFNLNNTSNYLYRINVEGRDEFIEYMKGSGIECGVHFYPLHMMDVYKNYGHDDMSKTEEEYRTTVSLPFHTFLTEDQIDYICNKVFEWKEMKNGQKLDSGSHQEKGDSKEVAAC